MVKNSYYDEHGLSQSFLKQYLTANPQTIVEEPEEDKWYTEKKSLLIGDCVDMQITDRLAYDNLIFASGLSEELKPTDKMLGVIHLAYEKVSEIFVESPETFDVFQCYGLEAARELGWNPKWGDEAVLKNVNKYYEYYLDLLRAKGKVVITLQDKEKVESLVIAIRTHENTCEYFQTSKTKQIIYQLPVYFEERGEECKALLDMVIIDHEAKTIRPVDIKTTMETIHNFPTVVRRFRYDIQAAFYTRALQHYKIQQGLSDYKILNFEFMVVSTTDRIVTPIIYRCSTDILIVGTEGRRAVYKEVGDGSKIVLRKEILGWQQLLDLHISYQEIGYSTHIDLLDGVVTLDWETV